MATQLNPATLQVALIYDQATIVLKRAVLTDEPNGLAPHINPATLKQAGEAFQQVDAAAYLACQTAQDILALVPGTSFPAPVPNQSSPSAYIPQPITASTTISGPSQPAPSPSGPANDPIETGQ